MVTGLEIDRFVAKPQQNLEAAFISPDFRTDFRRIWRNSWDGIITEEQRKSELTTLIDVLPADIRTKLLTEDSDKKTPLNRFVTEIKSEYKREKTSKMGQGKRLPKSERIHIRRQKAEERRF